MDVTSLDYGELVVLVRALHEARFPSMYNDTLVWSAPFIVQLHTDAVMEQLRRDDAQDLARGRNSKAAAGRQRWLNWRGRPENTVVMSHIHNSPVVARYIISHPEIMRDWLRPFIVDDDSLAEFVEEAKKCVAAYESGE
jgi:hypothetical protein